jgi:type IV secretion system protein TrbB
VGPVRQCSWMRNPPQISVHKPHSQPLSVEADFLDGRASGSSPDQMPELPTITNEQQLRLDVKLRRELGDAILGLLDDDSVEDVVLNPDSTVWAKRMNAGFTRVGQMSSSQAVCAMNTVASMRSMVLNYERPVLETELPLDGSRFEGLIPPVVRHPVFAIRRRPRRIFTLDQYCQSGILTDNADTLNRRRRRENFADRLAGLTHSEVIRAAIAAKKNILTAGSTGSGKTTFTNAILDGIAGLSPNDRVISIEDTTELQCSVANYVDLRAVGNVTMLDCLRACMRLKPSRIVVGEVRGAEAHAMLKAWNTGHAHT